jgi:hypothetical protein
MPVLTAKARSLLWKKPEGFGLTHCMNCALSWTRSGKDGGKLTICLLDREPVLDDMTDCDRYEAKPDKIGGPPAPSLLSATDETSSAPPEPSPAVASESPQEPEPPTQRAPMEDEAPTTESPSNQNRPWE